MWTNIDPSDQAILWALLIAGVFLAVKSVIGLLKTRARTITIRPEGTSLRGYEPSEVRTVMAVISDPDRLRDLERTGETKVRTDKG